MVNAPKLENDTEDLKVPKDEVITPVASPGPSPPILSPVLTVKPEYHLVPIRSNVPTYGLIYEGPAPEGWQKDPEWQKNVFSTNETVCYKNEYFYFKG
ncbi:hypothetical protein CAEBREN_10576 [Caenorhabditis brenneri]|uniref:Uncharacterized protein n=1 Tax=Caenorhabditis brenneri TaxID=135651 RepID=G0MQW4_CAEBE|nr:hypothetical protein CAEBREN_10576 [Caenorhabditis brenneri]